MRGEFKGLLLGFLGMTAFGLTLPVTRLVLPVLDPVFVGLGRVVVAAVVAGLWLTMTRSQLPNRGQWRWLLVVVAGVVVGFPLLSAWAMQTAPAPHGGVVLGILPLATALAGAFISSERPSVGFWLTSLAGSAAVVGYLAGNGTGAVRLGDLALLGAVISAAIGYAVGGQLARELGAGPVICWALVMALPVIVAPAWLMAPTSLGAVTLDAWAGFFCLALVSQTQVVQPFVTIAAAALLLGETIEPSTLAFAFIVISLVAVGRGMRITQAPRVPAVVPVYCRSKGE